MKAKPSRLRSVLEQLTLPLYFVLLSPHLICLRFSSSRELVFQDVCVWKEKLGLTGTDLSAFISIFRSDKYFRNIFYHRIRGVCAAFLNLYLPQERSFTISRDSRIGGGFYVYHPYCTIINVKSIGAGCTMRHLSTFGNKNEDNELIPTISDNVSFGANVTVIGKINIGENAIIGAGAVVTKSVPCNSIAAGNPARIIGTTQ